MPDKRINLETNDEQRIARYNNNQEANDFDDLIHIQHLSENNDESDSNQVKKYKHNIQKGYKILIEIKNEISNTDDAAKQLT